MQWTIKHGAHNRFNYAMEVSGVFSPWDLFSSLTCILHGVSNVCAGGLLALQTMTNVLNYLKVQKIDIHKVCNSSYGNDHSSLLVSIADLAIHHQEGQGNAWGHFWAKMCLQHGRWYISHWIKTIIIRLHGLRVTCSIAHLFCRKLLSSTLHWVTAIDFLFLFVLLMQHN
jgi:hypothetical protein